MSETTQVILSTEPKGAEPPKPPVADPNRPTWLPEKFKTAEEMAASYKELETKLGQNPPQQTQPDLSTVDSAKAALTQKGLDFDKYQTEFLKDGKLSDASIAELATKGISKEAATQFIEGQKASAELYTKEIHEHVGGQDRFNKLYEFAKTNLTPAEVEAYNKAVGSGDKASMKLILTGLNAKFDAQFGKDPNLINGGSPNRSSDVFQTFQEYNQARRDPQYKKNPVFAKAIESKLERSSFYKQK